MLPSIFLFSLLCTYIGNAVITTGQLFTPNPFQFTTAFPALPHCGFRPRTLTNRFSKLCAHWISSSSSSAPSRPPAQAWGGSWVVANPAPPPDRYRELWGSFFFRSAAPPPLRTGEGSVLVMFWVAGLWDWVVGLSGQPPPFPQRGGGPLRRDKTFAPA